MVDWIWRTRLRGSLKEASYSTLLQWPDGYCLLKKRTRQHWHIMKAQLVGLVVAWRYWCYWPCVVFIDVIEETADPEKAVLKILLSQASCWRTVEDLVNDPDPVLLLVDQYSSPNGIIVIIVVAHFEPRQREGWQYPVENDYYWLIEPDCYEMTQLYFPVKTDWLKGYYKPSCYCDIDTRLLASITIGIQTIIIIVGEENGLVDADYWYYYWPYCGWRLLNIIISIIHYSCWLQYNYHNPITPFIGKHPVFQLYWLIDPEGKLLVVLNDREIVDYWYCDNCVYWLILLQYWLVLYTSGI